MVLLVPTKKVEVFFCSDPSLKRYSDKRGQNNDNGVSWLAIGDDWPAPITSCSTQAYPLSQFLVSELSLSGGSLLALPILPPRFASSLQAVLVRLCCAEMALTTS